MKTGLLIVILVILAIASGAGKFVSVRNELAARRQTINADWQQIEADLQQRADLVPPLVDAIRLDLKDDKLVRDLSQARQDLTDATTAEQKIKANNLIDSALGRVLVELETHPDIKSNRTYQSLQYQFEGAENRILQSRRVYNDAVKQYNTELRFFPQNIVAPVSGFKRDDAYFKTEVGSRLEAKPLNDQK